MDAGFVIGAGINAIVRTIAPAGDGTGDVYVAGDFATYDGTPSSRIVRLNPDGTLDADFVIGAGFSNIVITLAQAGDGTGDVYAGGDFVTYDTTIVDRIARLNSDGSND